MLHLVVMLTADVPNPPPTPPPGLGNFGTSVIAWLKWGLIIGGMVGVLLCAGGIIVGRRNRGQLAQDSLVGMVWVLGGLGLASAAAVVVGAFAI